MNEPRRDFHPQGHGPDGGKRPMGPPPQQRSNSSQRPEPTQGAV
jgi:hypothetical protein